MTSFNALGTALLLGITNNDLVVPVQPFSLGINSNSKIHGPLPQCHSFPCSSSPSSSSSALSAYATSATSMYLDSISNPGPSSSFVGVTNTYLEQLSQIDTSNVVAQQLISMNTDDGGAFDPSSLQRVTEELIQQWNDVAFDGGIPSSTIEPLIALLEDVGNAISSSSSLWDIDITDSKGGNPMDVFETASKTPTSNQALDSLATELNDMAWSTKFKLNNLVSQVDETSNQARDSLTEKLQDLALPTKLNSLASQVDELSSSLENIQPSQVDKMLSSTSDILEKLPASLAPVLDNLELIMLCLIAVPRAIVEEVTDTPLEDVLTNIQKLLGELQESMLQLSIGIREYAVTSSIDAFHHVQSTPPMELVASLVEVVKVVAAVMLAVPRFLVEVGTGQTMDEILAASSHVLSDTNFTDLSVQLIKYASMAPLVLVALLRVLVETISGETVEDALVMASVEMVSLLEEWLPLLAKSVAFLLQQFASLLLEGGSVLGEVLF